MMGQKSDNSGREAGYRPRYRVRDLVLTVIGLVVLYVTVMACHERLADVERLDTYRLHVHGRYYIDNYKFGLGDHQYGDSGLLLGGEHFSSLIPYSQRPISEFAVVGATLIGVTGSEFFVFDMEDRAIPEDQRDMTIYADEASWRTALEVRGIIDIPRLEEPAVAAASRPITEVQPWRCSVAGGVLGLTDDDLAGLCALGTLPIAALIGFVFPGKGIRQTLVCLAIVAGAYGGVQLLIQLAFVSVMLFFFLPLALWISGATATIRCRIGIRDTTNGKSAQQDAPADAKGTAN